MVGAGIGVCITEEEVCLSCCGRRLPQDEYMPDSANDYSAVTADDGQQD
jgi:hypothetical protein